MSQVPVFFLLSLPLVGAFAMFTAGIVVIHQSSKVLNLAHGAMAMVPAFVTFTLVENSVPTPIALVLGIASGSLIGMAVERVFVRVLRRQGSTAQTVGTVAALGLLVSVAVKVWGTTPRTAVRLFPEGGIHVGASILRWGQVGLLGIALVSILALFALFRYTKAGLAMRSAADNRRAAALMGIDPEFTAQLSWALGGALAAIAGILLAPVTVLEPINLTLLVLPAYVAALLGGLSSLPGAAGGSAIVGVVLGMVPAVALIPGVGGFASQLGAPQLVLTIVALLVMALRGERFVGGVNIADFGGTTRTPVTQRRWFQQRRSRAEERQPIRTMRPALRTVLVTGVAVLLLAFPFLGVPFSIVGDAVQACIILLVAASLVLLTGWVGQISLAQATLVGVGAFATALLTNRADIQFPLNLPIVAVVSAGFAAAIGLVALRVRGLYLAVATLIVLWMSNEYLFRSAWLVGTGGSASVEVPAVGRSGAFPFFDFSERRTFYYVALAAAAAALWALYNIRDSKTGRAFFAVHGSETAAASLGINVTHYKLLAFAISGLLAGIAGNLLITGAGSASPQQFDFGRSLFYLSVAVVGGTASLGGAVGASLLFAALSEVFFRVTALSGWLDIVSAGLLTAVLLAYPGGLSGVPHTIGRAFGFDPRRRRRVFVGSYTPGLTAPSNGDRVPAEPRPLRSTRAERVSLLETGEVTVRFGGLTAVEAVSLSVRESEIVGLIGPNGAGKTTMFNAISGLALPSGGKIRLFGQDVTDWTVHRRAELGIARTFQVVQLFPQLSIFDNLLVATHVQNPTGVLAHVAVTSRSLRSETQARARVREVVSLLGLEEVAGRAVGELPLGTLRMVEVARAVVTGAKLVMLDEPASGLDNTETEMLANHLFHIRENLGMTILLIEHDVAMVTSVSDYIYVLNRGRLLAEGLPAEVQRDEHVIAAYLGTPEEQPVTVP
jgi:sulfate-transporting ATPase